MPAPSWDLAITVFFLIGIVFGYILQREKIVATLVSTYIALVVTQIFSGGVYDFFHGTKMINQVWVQANTSPFTIRVLVFVAVIALLTAKGGIAGSKSKGLLSPIEVLIVSFLTTGLIISSIFFFMPPETRDSFMSASRLATFVIKYYPAWIITPVIGLVVLGFVRKTD